MTEELIVEVTLILTHHGEAYNRQHGNQHHVEYGEVYYVSLTSKERYHALIYVLNIHTVERWPEANLNTQGLKREQYKRQFSQNIEQYSQKVDLQMSSKTLIGYIRIVVVVSIDKDAAE